mgnify:CR=1 FL=1
MHFRNARRRSEVQKSNLFPLFLARAHAAAILNGQALRQFLLHHIECRLDDLVHIIVLILAQAAAEDYARLGVGQLLVFGVQSTVLASLTG